MKIGDKKCKPCEGGITKLNSSGINELNALLESPWEIIDEMKISKIFNFKNYLQTMIFVNKIAEIAESEGHHPVLHVYYSKVQVEIWTHAILGLSENDFILAAKIDEVFNKP